ncbi:MAG TPA: TonB family protein [Thermoanaerobaculia bacterium]|nr:TonB family protein [Thermoanaerobaculia bacterium]
MTNVEGTPGPRATIFRAWRRALMVAAATVGLIALLVLGGRERRGPAVTPEETSAIVTVARADVRKEASARAESVANVERGDEVRVVGDRGAWLEVRTGGSRGFLRAVEVEREGDRESREERAKKILSFPPVYGVVGERTPVLLAPFPLAPRAGELAKGTVIPIHAVDHAYFAYRDRANGVAFVASTDVDLVPPDPTSPNLVPDRTGELRRLATLDVPTPLPTPEEEPIFPPEGEFPSAPAAPPPPVPPPRESGQGVAPAVLVSKIEPEYPPQAIRAQAEGSVILDVGIDETGRVTDVQVIRGLSYGLSEAAAAAVREWRYRPAEGPGGPIPSRKTVRILFTLRGGG